MTYRITRHFERGARREVVKTGLSLEAARAHCSDPETSSDTAKLEPAHTRTNIFGPWFDGYSHEAHTQPPEPEPQPGE